MPTIRSSTSSSPPPAASANFSSAAALGSPRRGTANCTASLFFLRVLFVGIDDARHQRMAHHVLRAELREGDAAHAGDRKSTRLNSSHLVISYAVFCLKK